MALDTRDYWKQKWNKKSAYVEEADFRVADSEFRRRKRRRFWRAFLRFLQVTGWLLFLPVLCYHLYKWFAR